MAVMGLCEGDSANVRVMMIACCGNSTFCGGVGMLQQLLTTQ